MADLTYPHLIQQFLLSQVKIPVPSSVQFETVAASVLGSKQRRFGPLPSVEVQFGIRENLRRQLDKGQKLVFFTPWGSRKQLDNQSIDIMEVMALKQLVCLQAELKHLGVESEFYFRVEDLTDYWLFDNPATPMLNEHNHTQVDSYAFDMQMMAMQMFEPGSAHMQKESDWKSYNDFRRAAMMYLPIFREYLLGNTNCSILEGHGWIGGIPQEQRDYYLNQYKIFYPADIHEEHIDRLAQYFASVLARLNLGLKMLPPQKDFIFITFGHPIPASPVTNNRIYYRSIPQRHTNNHRSPWLAKGYLAINDEGEVCPKSAGFGDEKNLSFIPNKVDMGGFEIQADYVLV